MARLRSVALSAPFLDPGRSGGTETYVRGLVPALAAARPDLRLTLLTTRRGAAALRADGWADLCTLVALPADEGRRARRLLAEQVSAPRAAARSGAQVLHALVSTGPSRSRVPLVVTVHDLTFRRLRTLPRSTALAMDVCTRLAVRAAAALVTATEASRAEVAAGLGIDPARLTVVPHGPGRAPGVPAPAGEVRAVLDLPPAARVVLCVGALRPHKGQAVLVRALPLLPDDVVLVLAGVLEPYADEVLRTADALGVLERVRLPGHLPDRLLDGAWALASAAAVPTRAEGFGLPLAEALGRGLPVAASDLPVLREVGGDGPHWFAPGDADGAARALEAALAAPHRRTQAQWTWADAAEGTLAVYDRVAAP